MASLEIPQLSRSTGLSLEETAKEQIAKIERAQQVPGYDDSFFIMNLAQIQHQNGLWNSHLPFVKPYYAVKCNPDPTLLRCLLQLGVGFDCASIEEIRTVLRLGVHPSNIIYANPCKAACGLAFARQNGVQMTTFDNVEELDTIKNNLPDAKLILRIFANDASALVTLGAKFGAPMDSIQALLIRAKELDLNLIGVSFHIGSGARDSNAMKQAIRNARLVWSAAESLGFSMSILDIGGGFQSSEPEFRLIADAVTEAFSAASFPQQTVVMAEPGRFFARSVFALVCRVIARRGRERDKPANHEPEMLYQNDGVYRNFMNVVVESETCTPAALIESGTNTKKSRQAGPYEYSIWGPTCDSVDRVTQKTRFDREVMVNDWLVYENMGAYTSATATRFNGFSDKTKKIYARLQ